MESAIYKIRKAEANEFALIGKLMVEVYSQLDGFPKPHEQPAYYNVLANVGDLALKPSVEILVAVNEHNEILGALVFVGDMQYYGSGGTATQEKNAVGFRLLVVSPNARKLGVGKGLTLACIEKAKSLNADNLIIHTTKAMQTAWDMYERLGFRRALDLDFAQGDLFVYGFRFALKQESVNQDP